MGKKEKNSREVNYDTKPIGTNKNRGCTDLPFLILFIVFWVGMYIIAGVAVETGDPKKLITPRDSRGQYCGVDNSKMPHQNENSNMDLTSKPFLYYLTPYNLPLSVQICVEECPTSTRLVTVDDVYCNYDVPPITDEVDLLIYISDNRCNWFFYESKPILGRCVLSNFTIPEIPPKVSEALGLNLDELINSGGVLANSKETTMKVMTDIINAKWFIVGGTVVGFVICFVYLILMRLIGKLLIWVTLLATNALLVSCSVWLYFYWQEYRLWYEQLTPEVKTDADLYELYGITAGFFTCAAITAIILLISIFLRKRINIAIEVIKEAAKAIAAMPLIVFFPLWNFALTIGLFAYFCYVYVHIITPVENVSVTSFGYSWTDSKVSFYLEWYHIFGCLWGLAFLSGVNQVTFSGAIASYYWTLDKSKLPLAPIISAFYRTVRYHLGSICVGSLMLAIVQVIRLFLYSFQKQAAGIKNVPCMSFLFCCADCCLKCIEGIVKWINKEAYIQIAINGSNFCISAFHAFGLILRNGLRIIALNFVTTFVLFLGKLSITGGTFFITWTIIKMQKDDLQLTFTVIPAVIVALIVYIISLIFLSLYDNAIDTIFMCFLEDGERNDGSPEKPFYMTKSLQRLTNVSNKKNKVAHADEF